VSEPLNELDRAMMARCIALARASSCRGELPFAAVVCKGEVVIAEAANRVAREGDVTRHAELLAISDAQRRLKSKRLKGCTLYSVVEPCPMCAFPIRETGISRVVFALRSPVMGGLTRWNILEDPLLARTMPVFFSRPPEVVNGLLAHDAEAAWRDWRPVLWALIKMRGCFVVEADEAPGARPCGANSRVPSGILSAVAGRWTNAVARLWSQSRAGYRPAKVFVGVKEIDDE
jgi:tRNA(adenine34) deaminase